MKKSVVFLVMMLLMILPIVSAQTYSGLDRFSDNARLFLSFGDKKVKIALDIREKEVNSALENIEANNVKEVNKNLENAMSKLLIVQEKVSSKSAEEVTNSVEEVVGKIEESNLNEEFKLFR